MQSYPISHITNNQVILKNSYSIPFATHKENISYEERLQNPDIASMFLYPYPQNAPKNPYEDSSRIRNFELLGQVYGNSQKEVEKNLKELTWLDGEVFLFNTQNGAYEALRRVKEKLKTLDGKYLPYLSKIGGTYKYRKIANTNRLSAHSYGIAIDINVAHSRYWLWDKTRKNPKKIPQQIIEIFESEGFIWGGKWWHYDTMHFEYRPEILCYGRS
ncbi:M15 family metallopeptidase [Helicobacter burdigaliensis]